MPRHFRALLGEKSDGLCFSTTVNVHPLYRAGLEITYWSDLSQSGFRFHEIHRSALVLLSNVSNDPKHLQLNVLVVLAIRR